jgi:Glycosyl hydrolases family 18.
MGLWPTPDLAALLARSGADRITLAFVVGGPQNAPAWAGVQPWDWQQLKQMVDKSGPKRCVASFGGASGVDLFLTSASEDDCVRSIGQMIDLFGFDVLDFDVEGAAVAMVQSVAKRNRCLKRIQDTYPDVHIHYTLPVMPDGLTADARNLLRNARDVGLQVHVVNIMAMDYGQGNPAMGDAAIEAALATKGQVDAIGLRYDGIGVTPMIGQNDTGEVFTLEDAEKLAAFARKTPWLTWISFWSVNRDVKKPGPLYQATNVTQEDNQFAKVLGRRSL